MTTTAPVSVGLIGLVNLPALAEHLPLWQFNVVTGDGFRAAAHAIRNQLGAGVIPVVLHDTPWPGMKAWTEKAATETRVVVLRNPATENPTVLDGVAEVFLPATLGQILEAAGLPTVPEMATVNVEADGSIASAQPLLDTPAAYEPDIVDAVLVEDAPVFQPAAPVLPPAPTVAPASPASSVAAPSAPVVPVAPVIPVITPVAPVIPSAPVAVSPVAPALVSPVAPASPVQVAPVAPVPVEPVAPTPVFPVAPAVVDYPVVPVAPEPMHAPVAPAEVAPVTPVAPVAPVQFPPAEVAPAVVDYPVAPVAPEPVYAPVAPVAAEPVFEPAPVDYSTAPADLYEPNVASAVFVPPSSGDIRREFTSGRNNLAHLLVVTAGKGGVGKTSISACLAQRAASKGLRVVLVDGNTGQGDIRTVLQIQRSGLPTIFEAMSPAVPIQDVLIDPATLNAHRPDKLEPLSICVVSAPTDAQSKTDAVTPEVYARIIAEAQTFSDLVVIDTQVVEAGDARGMVAGITLPVLRGGGTLLGLTDFSTMGISNLINRTHDFAGAGINRDQMLTALNRMPSNPDYNAEGMQQAFNQYTTFLGTTPYDEAVITATNAGRLSVEGTALAPLLDQVLARATGRPELFLNTHAPVGEAAVESAKPARGSGLLNRIRRR